MSPSRARTALACLLGAVASAACGISPPAPPAHMDIVFARIREGPPIDHRSAAARGVTLSLELAGRPRCDRDRPEQIYGFLIDADKDAQTGSTDAAFARLGIDARISAECDPATGRFVSRAGAVEIADDAGSGTTTLTIRTRVERLPSVDFYWIAFAHEGSTLVRAPGAPGFSAWAIRERYWY